ncbi:hypothetical protein SLEP1_g56494 [Rubroshorea leprosula]|uniref:Uncharacterized protein n=1 Tax=Rubroshorea leprosula TaxID=152421 RepID=A0AAV5MIH0_9ROSI|nr:hypothetical protein SLEP1_g56494 [Rubroshorea leprosula]
MIDISFAEAVEIGQFTECVETENMVMNMQTKNAISPTLRDIVFHFSKDNERLEQTFHLRTMKPGPLIMMKCQLSSVVNETFSYGPTFHGLHEENCSHASYEANLQEEFEDVAAVLCQGFLLWNSWAKSRLASAAKRPKNKNMMDVDIDFVKSLDNEMPDIFSPPKNPKSLMLPANRALCSNTLPKTAITAG